MKRKQWQAGVAVVDISPPVGLELAGFAVREQGSIGVLDNLFARALALDDGSKQAVLITCDLLGMEIADIAHIRQKIKAQVGLNCQNILVAASHTHSGPATMQTNGIGERDPAWLETLKGKIVESAVKAFANLEPVRLTYATGSTDIGINRRGKIPEGSINPLPDPDGPVDRELIAVFMKRMQANKPWIVLFNCACHPTVLGPENRLVSADYPGAAIRFIEKEFGDNTVALFMNGAAGNVNPVKANSYTIAQKLGKRVGAQVVKMAKMEIDELVPELNTAVADVWLPFAPIPGIKECQSLLEQYRSAFASAKSESEQKILNGCLQWAQKLYRDAQKDSIRTGHDIEIQCITLGKFAVIAVPCEVFAETGLSIKQHSHLPTLIAGYANGNVGYLPPGKEIAKKGYEVLEAHKYYGYPNHYAAPAEENVQNAAITLNLQMQKFF